MSGAFAAGTTVGRYVIEREVGRGGMGVVYRALDPALNRAVALKVLAGHLDHEHSARLRFHREAASIANLKHPHIALVYEFGEHDGLPFIALEWAEGRTLKDLLADDGPLPLDRALPLLEQLAGALDFAHARGVIHRDLKPANVIIGPDDHATIVDFGLAQLTSAPALTVSGSLFGTPRYVSPEQVRGEDLDGRADQYSLAVMVYEALTGRLPFAGDTTPALLHHHLYTPPVPATEHNPELPGRVEAALNRALSKNPADRFATLAEFGAALRGEVVPVRPSAVTATAARPWLLPLALTLVVLGLMGLLAAFAVSNVAQLGETVRVTETARALETAPTATQAPTDEPTEEPTPEPAPTDEPQGGATPTLPPTPVAAAPQEGGWWPMSQWDAARTGYVPEGLRQFNAEPAWVRPPRSSSTGGRTGLVVGGGQVFFGVYGGGLRALDWRRGVETWSLGLGAETNGDPVLYGDEENFRILLPLESGEILGVDGWSGAEVWRLGGDVLQGAPTFGDLAIAPEGVAYASVEKGWLHALNPVSGEVQWSLALTETAQFYQPPSAIEGRVFLAGTTQSVYAIDTNTQEIVWAGDLVGDPTTPPTILGEAGLVFAGTARGVVHALWLDSGRQAWEDPAQASSVIVGLATDGDRLYATAQDGTAYAWNIWTGQLVWSLNTGLKLAAPPLTDGAYVLLSTTNGDFRFINAESGVEEANWRLTLNDGGWHSPAPAGAWLFVPAWNIYGLQP
jgi:outer membrane protein assembly factor BamB